MCGHFETLEKQGQSRLIFTTEMYSTHKNEILALRGNLYKS